MAILDIPTDEALAQRNAKRVAKVKKQMGSAYLLHPANRVQRLQSHTNLAQIGRVLTRPGGSR